MRCLKRKKGMAWARPRAWSPMRERVWVQALRIWAASLIQSLTSSYARLSCELWLRIENISGKTDVKCKCSSCSLEQNPNFWLGPWRPRDRPHLQLSLSSLITTILPNPRASATPAPLLFVEHLEFSAVSWTFTRISLDLGPFSLVSIGLCP